MTDTTNNETFAPEMLEMFAAYRAMFHAHEKRELRLDNDALLICLQTLQQEHEAAGTEPSEADYVAAMSDAESEADVSDAATPSADSPTAANDKAASAFAMAERALQNDTFLSHLEAIAKGGDTVRGGPFTIMLDLEAIYGDDIADFPEPGSAHDDEGRAKGDNTLTDKYKVKVFENGAWRDRIGYWYVDFAYRLPRGQYYRDEADYAAEALNTKGTTAKLPAHIKNMGVGEKNAHKKRMSRMFSDYVGAVRKAVKLLRKIKAINELPGVELSYIQEEYRNPETGEMEARNVGGTIPFQIWPVVKGTPQPGKAKAYSVSGILALDPSEAAANGGTWDALMATEARGTGDDETDKDNAVPAIAQATQLYDYMKEVSAYFMDPDKGKSRLTALSKALHDPKANALVLLFGDFMHSLDQVWNSIEDKYRVLDAARSGKSEEQVKANRDKLAAAVAAGNKAKAS